MGPIGLAKLPRGYTAHAYKDNTPEKLAICKLKKPPSDSYDNHQDTAPDGQKEWDA
ncbi:hypothetical protein OLX08_08210 [Nereida ignava]|uniref:hypothetical protein n=1 Tax=Nereida ignava TaxID=282199 RepID=UPI00399B338B